MKVILTLTHEKRTVIHCKELIVTPDDDVDLPSRVNLEVEVVPPGVLNVKETITDGTS